MEIYRLKCISSTNLEKNSKPHLQYLQVVINVKHRLGEL